MLENLSHVSSDFLHWKTWRTSYVIFNPLGQADDGQLTLTFMNTPKGIYLASEWVAQG